MRIRKIIILLLIGLSVVKVKAYTFSDWSTEYPEGYEDFLIESEVRYKWYKEVETDIEYLPRSKFGNKSFDLNDYIYTEFSEKSLTMPEENEDRTVVSELEEQSFTKNDIDHIYIKNIIFKSDVYFSEISVIDKRYNIKIPYTFEKDGERKYDVLNDNKNDLYTYIHDMMNISINLGNKYNVEDLILKIEYKADYDNQMSFDVIFGNGMNTELFFKQIYLCICKNGCTAYGGYDPTFIATLKKNINYYKYKDKLYKTYNVEREYMEGYHKEINNYIKDESDSKYYYRFINSSYYLTDYLGNVISPDMENYCYKNYCTLNWIEEKKEVSNLIETHEVLENPKTIDNINTYIHIGTASVILIIMSFVFLKKRKKYVKRLNSLVLS